MMAAMMPPAVAPMVAAYRGRTAGLGATPAFAAGYLIAWLVAG
jgi:predicted metal-binding membrane protein